MVNLDKDKLYEEDLHDDLVMNEDKRLYQFIDEDPVKAYYLGKNINIWKSELDSKQQYLYAKELRHVVQDVQDYFAQIRFWASKFDGEEVVDIMKFHQYILNNLILQDEKDIVKLCLHFGLTYYALVENKKKDE